MHGLESGLLPKGTVCGGVAGKDIVPRKADGCKNQVSILLVTAAARYNIQRLSRTVDLESYNNSVLLLLALLLVLSRDWALREPTRRNWVISERVTSVMHCRLSYRNSTR